MDLEALVERNDENETREKLELSFYSEAKTEAIREALRFVSAACIHSKHRIADVTQDTEMDDPKEFIIIDCEDSDHKTTQGLTQELLDYCDYEYELGSSNRNADQLFVVADLPEEFVEEDEEE